MFILIDQDNLSFAIHWFEMGTKLPSWVKRYLAEYHIKWGETLDAKVSGDPSHDTEIVMQKCSFMTWYIFYLFFSKNRMIGNSISLPNINLLKTIYSLTCMMMQN